MDYITIKEYAERAHVSQQTAYKRAKDDRYKQYFKRIKGIIMVDSALLELNQFFNGESTIETEPPQARADSPLNGVSTNFSTVENDMIVLLKERLEKADKQIDILNNRITELLSIVAEQGKAIESITREHNLLEAGKLQAESAPPVEIVPTEKEESTEPQKKGFFSRLFGR